MNKPKTHRSTNESGVERIVELHPIVVDSIYIGMNGNTVVQKKGTMTAQLKQNVVITKNYPMSSVANSNQDSLYTAEDFKFEKKSYKNESNRVAWIDVPEGMTVEQVTAKLQNHPDACIHQVLSNTPILTTQQKYAIQNGLITLDTVANRQVVRQRKGATDETGLDISEQIILDDNGKPFYRVNYFKTTFTEDSDLRTSNPDDVYLSEAIELELSGNPMSIFGN
jgi:hypothetical protein